MSDPCQDALRKLVAECKGWLGLETIDLWRDLVGPANFDVMQQRIREAEAAFASLKAETED